MKTLKNRKGFTLIEMLVVIAIIAILVSITVPTVAKARTKAAASADAANLRSLSATIATRYVTTTDSAELKAGLTNPGSKLFPEGKNYIFVYREGSAVNSYFTDSLFSVASLRGTPYNTKVSESGDTSLVNYDSLSEDAELLCIFTGTAGSAGLLNDFVADISANAEAIYKEKYDDAYAEALADARETDEYQTAYDAAASTYKTTSAMMNAIVKLAGGSENIASGFQSAIDVGYDGTYGSRGKYAAYETLYGDLYDEYAAAKQEGYEGTASEFATDYVNKYLNMTQDEYATSIADSTVAKPSATISATTSASQATVDQIESDAKALEEITGESLVDSLEIEAIVKEALTPSTSH